MKYRFASVSVDSDAGTVSNAAGTVPLRRKALDLLLLLLECRPRAVSKEQISASIEDLGSQNGTWLGGERLTTSRPLADGDVVRLGSVSFTFRLVHLEPSWQVSEGSTRLCARNRSGGQVAREVMQ